MASTLRQIGSSVKPNPLSGRASPLREFTTDCLRKSFLQIESIGPPKAGNATLAMRLPAGTTNRVQFKTNLTDAAWTDLPVDIIVSAFDSRTNKVDSSLGNATQRFYRVRQLQ